MENEKRYKIINLKENINEEKKLIPTFGTVSLAYAGLAALLLHAGVNGLADENYVKGILSTIAGTSFAVSDIFVVLGLKEFIANYINDKEEYEELSR